MPKAPKDGRTSDYINANFVDVKELFFSFDHFAVKPSSRWGQVKATRQTKVSVSVFMETWRSASNSRCDGDV